MHRKIIEHGKRAVHLVKRNKIAFTIAVVAVIVLIAILLMPKNSNNISPAINTGQQGAQNIPAITIPEKCASIASSDDKNLCIAVELKDISYCNNIPDAIDSVKHYSCYVDVAEKMNDATICAGIKLDEQRSKCYTNLAVNNKNPALCESTVGLLLNSNCYTLVAVKMKDISLCDKITNSYYKTKCEEAVRVA
jgi:hypothetical protein